MSEDEGGFLFKPDFLERLVREITANVVKSLRIKYRELELEAKKEETITLKEVVPEFSGVNVRSIFDRPEKGVVSRTIGAKISLDGNMFIDRLVKILNLSGIRVNTSDLVRLGLMLLSSYLLGDRESFRATLEEIDFWKSRINSWVNIAYKKEKNGKDKRLTELTELTRLTVNQPLTKSIINKEERELVKEAISILREKMPLREKYERLSAILPKLELHRSKKVIEDLYFVVKKEVKRLEQYISLGEEGAYADEREEPSQC